MTSNRRRFSLSILYGLWAVIGSALGLPAAVYLMTPPKSRRGPDWIDAGDISRLPLNNPEEVVFRRNRVDGWKVTSEKNTAWVVRKSAEEVIAYAPQCTHLGCAYHWVERTKEFLCPCHTSTFDIDGKVLLGPAPRPLDRYEIRMKGSRLLLGKIVKSDTQVSARTWAPCPREAARTNRKDA
jgi:menaquinol-cytochrome c reductase iron-sulfur subunit